MRSPTPRILLVALLMLSILGDSGLGAGLLESALLDDAADEAGPAASGAWEGSGAAVMFADRIDASTADHFAAAGIDGYYGGAAPEVDADPVLRWRHEPYRWAVDALEGTPAPWEAVLPSSGDGTWRFGDDGQGPAYPAGAHAGLVTPIIDLRSVPPVEEHAAVRGHTGVPTLYDEGSFGFQSAPQASRAYQDLTPGGNVDADGDARRSTAALRLVHEYGFRTTAEGLLDGGRVEAAVLDPATGWTPWFGIEPIHERLRVGDAELEARGDLPGTGPTTIRAGEDTVLGDPEPICAGEEPCADVPTVAPQSPLGDGDGPWMYQGAIAASEGRGGPWQGFGADSGGSVDSVFDLGHLAGHVVRLRFVAVTAEATSPTQQTTPGLGWTIHELEVHGAAPPGVDIIGLENPGDNTLLPEGASFTPRIAIHNRASEPLDADVHVAVESAGGVETVSRSLRLGAGPEGRGVVELGPSSALGIAERGTYTVRVDVDARLPVDADGVRSALSVPVPSSQVYHFAVGPGGGWEARGVDVIPEDPSDGIRFLLRGETARIEVALENLNTTPITIDLAGDAEIRPVLQDLRGQPVGSITPLTPSVDVPVSRDTSGALGEPGAQVRAAWEWSGTSVAQALRLVVLNQTGAEILDGGRVLVQAVEPAALDARFNNPWRYDPGCQREAAAQGADGVVVCTATATATSPALPLRGVHFVRGHEAALHITHRGDGLQVRVEHIDTGDVDPDAPPGPSAAWDLVDTMMVPPNGSWIAEEMPMQDLAPGWYRLVLAGAQGSWSLDALRVELEGIPVLWHTFDVAVEGASQDVQAGADSESFHMHGIDGAGDVDTDVEDQNVVVGTVQAGDDGRFGATYAFFGEAHAGTDKGSLTAGTEPLPGGAAPVLPGGTRYHIPSGRVVEDAVLQWSVPVDLQGVRPRLEFRHWFATAQDGEARVEVSTDGPDGPWDRIATFAGTVPGTTTRPVSLSLSPYTGSDLHIRLVYHNSPSADLREVGPGWLVEDTRVVMNGLDGPAGIPLQDPHVTGGDATRTIQGMEPTASLEADHANLVFLREDQCAERGWKENTFDAGPAIVSEPVDLTTSTTPIIELSHRGDFALQRLRAGEPAVTQVDLEYQVLGDDGEWPLFWSRATPHDIQTGQALERDPRAGTPALDIIDGSKYPFLFDPDADSIVGKGQTLSTTWDLGSLIGEVARFRLHAWMEISGDGRIGSRPSTAPMEYCVRLPYLDWDVLSLRVREERHITDAAVVDVAVVADDLARLQDLDPLGFVDAAGTAYTGHERATVAVRVHNPGIAAVTARSHLSAVPLAAGDEPPVVRFVNDMVDPPILTDLPFGDVTLGPNVTETLRFIVDTRRSPAGAYRLDALVETVDGIDTNPVNDIRSRPLQVHPVRAIFSDPSASTLDPVVGPAEAARAVTVGLRNEGNVDESQVSIEARVVRIEGQTLHPIMDLLPQSLSLARRDGTATASWLIEEGRLANHLEPGVPYAVEVSFQPTPGSAGEHPPVQDLGGAQTVLMRFFAEQTVYRTDFGAENVTSLAEELFPADRPWTPTTLLDGQPLAPGSDLPRWELVDADEAVSRLGGHATGSAWLLPSYEGVEALEHSLTSPELPGHLINNASRAALAMRYNLGEGGEAVVETCASEGGVCVGPWQPVDELRSGRVAIVVAPDYPQVTGSWIPQYPTDMEGHPAAPFITDDANYPDAKCPGGLDDDGHTAENRCWWTPYPAPRSNGDPGWRQALDAALLRLGAELGADNVGVYTTVGPRFGMDLQGGALEVEDELGRTMSFPVGDLDMLDDHLETYHGILLFGDGVTETYAARSPSMVRMFQHAGGVPAPDPLMEGHFEHLFTTLQEARGKGIKVLGAIGPSTAALAESGVLGDAPATTWQTPDIPATPPVWGQLRCTVDGGTVEPVGEQPKPACPISFQDPSPDPTHPRNYYYFSPQDARSLALRDLVGGIEHSLRVRGTSNPELAGCNGHPVVPLFGACMVPDPVVLGPGGAGPDVLTASGTSDLDQWLDTLLAIMASNTGALPAGDGTWRGLPADLAFPTGGTIERRDDASLRFVGSPFKVRVVVEADPASNGHAGFALDRFVLLGTPNEDDLGVRLVHPEDGRTYSPGAPFGIQVLVRNNGLEATPATIALVEVEQTGTCGAQNPCPSPSAPYNELLPVPPLAPGESRTLEPAQPFSGGFFPNRDDPRSDPASRFLFRASLQDVQDVDAENDVDEALALGRALSKVSLLATAVEPNQAPRTEVDEVAVRAEVQNEGTQAERVLVSLVVEDARPRACRPAEDRTIFRPCAPDADRVVTPFVEAQQVLEVALDGRGETFFPLDLDALGIGPGVYRATIRSEVFVDGAVASSDEQTRWLHLSDPSVAPDGGWAADGADASDVDSLRIRASSNRANTYLPVSPDGVVVGSFGQTWDGQGRAHNGAYGPDPQTVAYPDDDATLQHGWQLTGLEGYPPGAPGAQPAAFEWQRSDRPSTADRPISWSGSPAGAEAAGRGDFGDDHLVWHPYDASGSSPDVPLTLASFEAPRLTFMSKHGATEHTAFVVEMQVAVRSCEPGASTRIVCSWTWSWAGDPSTPQGDEAAWFTLQPAGGLGSSPFANSGGRSTSDILDTGNGPLTTRKAPSNPLAGLHGLWGASGQPTHAEASGWQRLSYPVPLDDEALQQYCRDAVRGSETLIPITEVDPCRYAHAEANLGGFVARPVRFRLRAASFGGDEGINRWLVDDLALTDHAPRFAGVGTIPLSLLEQQPRLIPIRLHNDGSALDEVEVSVRATEAAIPDVSLSLHTATSAPGQETLRLVIPPGDSRALWLRVEVGLGTGFDPGFTIPHPVVVEARSLRDPLADASVLVDASFTTRPWGDLEVRDVVLGQGGGGTASVGVPASVSVFVRNGGDIPIGGPGEPIVVRLFEERHLEDGTIQRSPARDAEGDEVVRLIDQVDIFRNTRQDEVVTLEWVPPAEGRFDLVAEVNLPTPEDGVFQLPETDVDNNVLDIPVVVGPVLLSDVQITDAYLVELVSGDRVDRVVSGHAYRVVAELENMGRADAVDVKADFRIGAAEPFSTRTAESVDGDHGTHVFTSSVWKARLRADGAAVWPFAVDVSALTPSASTAGKSFSWQVPVDHYDITVLDTPRALAMAPGEQVVERFTVRNAGNALAKVVVAAEPRAVDVHLARSASVLPGEEVEIEVVLTAPQALSTTAELPPVQLSSAQDPELRVPLPLQVSVDPNAPVPVAEALPLRATPGNASLEAVLSNPSNAPVAWQLADVSHPLVAPERGTWEVQTPAFGRNFSGLPLAVAPHTGPGVHAPSITLRAVSGEQTRLVEVPVELTVDPAAGVQARLVRDRLLALQGETVPMEVVVDNVGNVPVRLSGSHDVEPGVEATPVEEVVLPAGASRTLPFTLRSGDELRMVGTTNLSWAPAADAGDAHAIGLPWRVELAPGAVRIVSSSIAERPEPGRVQHVRVIIENPGNRSVEAEVLLAADGVLQDRQVVELPELGRQVVEVSYLAGKAGSTHDIQVVARPAGVLATPDDELFFDTGDAVAARVSPAEDRFGVGVPAPPAVLLVAALLLAARRRRR